MPAANLHVTLVFLGWRAEDEVAKIAAAALDPVRGMEAPTLSPEDVTGVPARRPRLFAVDLADASGAADDIQAACEWALGEAGLHEPEERAFWPHVTVARVRRGERPGRPQLLTPPQASFTPETVVLYRSDVTRDGARYTVLERVPLSAGASRRGGRG